MGSMNGNGSRLNGHGNGKGSIDSVIFGSELPASSIRRLFPKLQGFSPTEISLALTDLYEMIGDFGLDPHESERFLP